MGQTSVKIGATYGRWHVLSREPGTPLRFYCRCACGTEKPVRSNHLAAGLSWSCGCFNREQSAKRATARNTKHGHCRRKNFTGEYTSWTAMKGRCHHPATRDYHLYGGRGIRVCARWESSFEAFLTDMGRKPSPKHSIDRINPDGDYEPGNCRWATPLEQSANRRDRRITKEAES